MTPKYMVSGNLEIKFSFFFLQTKSTLTPSQDWIGSKKLKLYAVENLQQHFGV